MIKETLKIEENELAIDIAGGKMAGFRQKELVKKGARVFQEGRIFSASFLGEISDDELGKMALRNEIGSLPYDHELPKDRKYTKSFLSSDRFQGKMASKLSGALGYLEKKAKDFIFQGKAKSLIGRTSYVTTNGVDYRIEYEICDWYLTYKHKKSANLIDGVIGDSLSLGQSNYLDGIDRCLPYLDVFENEVAIENGKKPVLFLNSGNLFPKLSESFYVDKYKMDAALYSGRLGEKLFSDQFTLYDLNYAPEFAIIMPFDEEGTIRKEPYFPLIKEGIFTNIITDLKFAKKYCLSPTGNGHRSFDSSVTTSLNSLVVKKGQRDYQKILSDLGECLVVMMASGGDYTDKGEYSTPVQLGFFIKNGKIVGRLPQITVKSSVEKMFGVDLLEISRDSFFGPGEANPHLFVEMDVFLN